MSSKLLSARTDAKGGSSIAQEFEACIAEYKVVHEELRDRTNGARRVTDLSILALGGVMTLTTLSLNGILTPPNTIPPAFPPYYLLLLVLLLFLFLAAVYVDESCALYIAQEYVISHLRPTMRELIANSNGDPDQDDLVRRIVNEHVWEWDAFHSAARAAPAAMMTGVTRGLVTFILPTGIPSALYVFASIHDKGYLQAWEVLVVSFFVIMMLLHFLALFRLRTQVHAQFVLYKQGKVRGGPFGTGLRLET